MYGDWFHTDPPTRIQTLLTGTVLPVAAVLLLVDILVGLVFLRWAMKNRTLILRSMLLADLLLLVVTTAFLAWASTLPFGSFGYLGVLILALAMRYTYESALLTFFPALVGTTTDKGQEAAERPRRLVLPWVGSAPYIAFCLIALAIRIFPNPSPFLQVVALGVVAVGGVTNLVVSVLVPATLPARLRNAGASRTVSRMARFAWCPIGLQFGFLVLLPFQFLPRFIGSLPLAGLWMTLSTYGYYVTTAILYVLPTLGIVGTAAALLRHEKEMKKPASPPASD